MAKTIDIKPCVQKFNSIVSVEVVFTDGNESETRVYLLDANDISCVTDNINPNSAVLNYGPYVLNLTNDYATLMYNGIIQDTAQDLAVLSATNIGGYAQ